jgi:hypothetical protein
MMLWKRILSISLEMEKLFRCLHTWLQINDAMPIINLALVLLSKGTIISHNIYNAYLLIN